MATTTYTTGLEQVTRALTAYVHAATESTGRTFTAAPYPPFPTEELNVRRVMKVHDFTAVAPPRPTEGQIWPRGPG